jgi:hypothetical protein
MKLEIKHLAGYLPYDLLMCDEPFEELCKKRNQQYHPSKLKAISFDGKIIVGKIGFVDLHKMYWKPCLIPLSKFNDINSPEMFALNVDLHHQIELCNLANQYLGYWSVSYGLAEICFANHIDIFNLIPQGLAVEKN